MMWVWLLFAVIVLLGVVVILLVQPGGYRGRHRERLSDPRTTMGHERDPTNSSGEPLDEAIRNSGPERGWRG